MFSDRAIKAANKKHAEADLPPIAGRASPAYVMAQMGDTSPDLALDVCARKMERKRDTGQRMDALIRGADSAQTGTNGETVILPVAGPDNKKPA
jgi:hypothetical protein